MATLLWHFVSDFLRDEHLRCRVMENDGDAYDTYGLSPEQQDALTHLRDTGDRLAFLAAVNREIGPILEEVQLFADDSIDLAYPQGHVIIREVAWKTLSGTEREVSVRGYGLTSGCQVSFASGGSSISGTFVDRKCDPDVWQRLRVKADLPAGSYEMTISRPDNDAIGTHPITIS
jgi:hypothetical protein